MTTKLIPIKKLLHCPFCPEGSAGLIYPDGALAEAHFARWGNCSKGIQMVWIHSGIVGSSFLYII